MRSLAIVLEMDRFVSSIDSGERSIAMISPRTAKGDTFAGTGVATGMPRQQMCRSVTANESLTCGAKGLDVRSRDRNSPKQTNESEE